MLINAVCKLTVIDMTIKTYLQNMPEAADETENINLPVVRMSSFQRPSQKMKVKLGVQL